MIECIIYIYTCVYIHIMINISFVWTIYVPLSSPMSNMLVAFYTGHGFTLYRRTSWSKTLRTPVGLQAWKVELGDE